jgi:four helix bundle protein
MLPGFDMANKVEELPLYAKVREFWTAVSAILDRPGLRNDRDLCGQIERANDSIHANLQEGFEQPTDASFANFVFTAKGSAAEVMARAQEAHAKGHITSQDLRQILDLGEPLGKMMGGFIKYLSASGFTDRGRHAVAPRPPKPAKPRHGRRPPPGSLK